MLRWDVGERHRFRCGKCNGVACQKWLSAFILFLYFMMTFSPSAIETLHLHSTLDGSANPITVCSGWAWVWGAANAGLRATIRHIQCINISYAYFGPTWMTVNCRDVFSSCCHSELQARIYCCVPCIFKDVPLNFFSWIGRSVERVDFFKTVIVDGLINYCFFFLFRYWKSIYFYSIALKCSTKEMEWTCTY